MTAGTVRAGVQTFIAAGNIPGVAQVFLDYPWRLGGQTLAITPARNWGAVCWPHIVSQHERRLTFPAGTGSKEVTYRIGLMVVFQYRIPASLPAGQAEDAWAPLHDGLLDALVALLRSDQTLGGVVLQAGEGEGEQLTIGRDLPRVDGGVLHCWSAIEFDATEIVVA